MLPSALYLKHARGDAIGPLSLTAVEVLFDNRVVDAKTPISFDGERFGAIEEWPEVLRRLEAVKTRANQGEKVWGSEGDKASAAEAAASAPSPSAEKRITLAAETSGLGRMLRISVRKQTGRLTFSSREGDLVLTFKDGKVATIETTVPGLGIGDYLLAHEIVDAQTLAEAEQMAPSMGGDIGGAMIAAQKIEPHVYFDKFVGWAKQALGAIVARDFDDVDFEEVDVPSPPFPLGFDRLGVAIEAVRSGMRFSRGSELLQSKRPCPLIISQVEGVMLEDVKLKPRELRALKAVNGVKTFGQLLEELGGSEEKTLSVMHAVHFASQAGFVAFGDDPLLKKELSEANAVNAEFERLSQKNFFEILNVSEANSDDDVRSQYAELAKKYHPDKIRAEAAPELLEARRKIFALVSEAAEALETENQRYQYAHDLEQGVVGGKDDAEKLQASLQAETLYKKAEILLKVRKYDEARAQIEQAIELNGADTEFKILRAYLSYLIRAKRGEAQAGAEKATKAILALMKNDANIASGYLYLGHLQNALDKPELALKYFEKVLEYDEHHAEATSQVRVLRMRKDKAKKKKRWI